MNAVDLAPYQLDEVGGLEDSLKQEEGHGSYGVVYRVTVNGLSCIAKCLHKIFLKEVSLEERESIKVKFMNECSLLSKLSHPNIVHFIGVHHGHSKHDLVLIMECLHTDVAAFVKSHPRVPVSIKTTIMLDVSYGLLYLHTHNPAIIHRDLTAPNVLLTNDLRGKIADLGVSKVLTDPYLIKHTTAPGNVNYMAPETKTRNPTYGTSVDIFSAGHLIIHISIQDWPKLYKVENHLAVAPGQMEIAERRDALDRGMGKDHCMYNLAVDCLHDNPEQRPSTVDFNKRLNKLCMRYPRSLNDLCQIIEDCKVKSSEVASERMQLASELSEQLERQRAEIQLLERTKREAQNEISTHKLTIQVYKEDFESERRDREAAHSKLMEFEERTLSLTRELAEKKQQVEELQLVLRKRCDEVDMLRREKQQLLQHLRMSESNQRERKISKEGFSSSGSQYLSHNNSSVPSPTSLRHARSFPPDSSEHASECTNISPSPKHKYANIREELSSSQIQQYITLATNPSISERANRVYSPTQGPMTLLVTSEPQDNVQIRDRAFTESSISCHTTEGVNNKTTPSSVKHQTQLLQLVKKQEAGEKFDDPIFLSERQTTFDQATGKKDSLPPVTRGRSQAISRSNIDSYHLATRFLPPNPPTRHQSLSRARSNPNETTKGQIDPSVYEHVPPRFEQSLSIPSAEGDGTQPTQRRQMASPVLHVTENKERSDTISPGQNREHQQPLSCSQQLHITTPSQTPCALSRPRSATSSPSHLSQFYPQWRSEVEHTNETKVPQFHSRRRNQSDPIISPYENVQPSSNDSKNVRFQIAPNYQDEQKPEPKNSDYQHNQYPFIFTNDNIRQQLILRKQDNFGYSTSTEPNQDTSETQGQNRFSMFASTAEDYDHQAYSRQVNSQESFDLPPLDPNLKCPICDKHFRVGQIQAFRSHYELCNRMRERI